MEEVRLAVLKALFFSNCQFIEEYKNDKDYPESWKMCKQCILRKMPWLHEGHNSILFQDNDLCFAIWHEDILNEESTKA